MNFLRSAGEWIRSLFGGPASQVGLRAGEPAAMLALVQATREQELDCEEAYALMDEFAERVKRGDNAADLVPLVQHHLDLCPGCKEEYEALLRMMDEKREA